MLGLHVKRGKSWFSMSTSTPSSKWPSYTFVLVLRSPCNNVINHVINNVVNQANFPASDEGYNSDWPGSRVHPIWIIHLFCSIYYWNTMMMSNIKCAMKIR